MSDLWAYMGLAAITAFCAWGYRWASGQARRIVHDGKAWDNVKRKEVQGAEAEQIARGFKLIAFVGAGGAVLGLVCMVIIVILILRL